MATTTAADIARPPRNPEMKELDRSFFKQTVQTSALTIFDARNLQKVRAQLASSRDLLSTTTIKPIVDDETHTGSKCILMKPHVKSEDPGTWNERWADFLKDGTAKIRPYDITVTYDDWDMSDILGAILPEHTSEEDQEAPSGFAQVGHVAHLNLREHFLPYKHLIGQVLLDKNPQVKTVINKLHDVGTESAFRTFPYEVLAGVDDMNVTVHHSGCEFKFNFAEVYWNTRNGHEHERLIATFKEGEAVCDVMAGVGPFAIPSGKKGVWVRANDLNPACYAAMCAAIKSNKVDPFVTAANLDGAKFITTATQDLLQTQRVHHKKPKLKLSRNATAEEKQSAQSHAASNTLTLREPPTFDHFVMNLPASAITFLPAFKGIYHAHETLFTLHNGQRTLPMIHVYAFQARKNTEDEEQAELLQRLSENLGHALDTDRDEVNLQRCRLVAPNKLFYCASFRLPGEVAFAGH